MRKLFCELQKWYRRRAYRPGRILSGFIARDVRREIKSVSVERLDEGMIIGQVRTNNVLYLSKGLAENQNFGEPILLEISSMWKWSGKPWGGLPNGTSIVDQIQGKDKLPNKAPEATR